jgi:chemotaxis protein histidine kinase CheA
MDLQGINTELKKFNVTDIAIAELSKRYMPLVIAGLDDKEGFDAVHEARMDIKARRIEVTKTGKGLREDATKFSQAVIKEEKRIVALLAPIEDHLQSEEDKIENEKKHIKEEADRKEAERIQARVDKICSFGATFNGQMYSVFSLQIPVALVKTCTDEQFIQFINQIQAAKAEAEAKEKSEEEARQLENARLAKIAEEQKIESDRLAKIAQEQAVEAARLKAIADEQKRVEDEKRRKEELEKAKIEAAEKARIETEQRIKREADEKAKAEAKERAYAEKKAAAAPDKKKIDDYVSAILSVPRPEMKTSDGKVLMDSVIKDLIIVCSDAKERISDL